MNRDASLINRLWNWGAYARIAEDKPDSSCANPIFDQWIPSKHWDPAWGAPEPPERYESGPDEPDAIEIDGWIRQLDKVERESVVRKFKWEENVGSRRLEEALDALDMLMGCNRMTIERMRRLGVA